MLFVALLALLIGFTLAYAGLHRYGPDANAWRQPWVLWTRVLAA